MTTDPTEAATRARMAERTAFARGARMGSEAENAAAFLQIRPIRSGPSTTTAASTNDGWTFAHRTVPPPPPPPSPLRPGYDERGKIRPPGPDYQPVNGGRQPHVEQSSPSINPLAALGRLISGVNVPPAVAGVTRALLEAAAVGALSKAASLLAVAHVPMEYAALAAAGVMVLRAAEALADQWGKGT